MKTKKLFMSLGTVAAVTAPVVSAVSCGTLLSSDNMEGQKVGWNDHSRTIYFNLFNQNVATQKGNMEPFMKVNGTTLGGSFPTLEIAQKWEQVAGYSIDKLGKVDNLQNARKINDGEIVHVVMAAEHFVWRNADDLHSEKWRDAEGYYLKWAFPFHTLENTRLHVNDKTDLSLLNFYQSYKPFNIHTNFWKALNVLIAYKLGNGADQTVFAGASPTLSTDPVFKKALDKDGVSDASEFDKSVWKTSMSTGGGSIERLESVYQKYHNKEIILTDEDVQKIYTDDIKAYAATSH